jgi:hypothetical protein
MGQPETFELFQARILADLRTREPAWVGGLVMQPAATIIDALAERYNEGADLPEEWDLAAVKMVEIVAQEAIDRLDRERKHISDGGSHCPHCSSASTFDDGDLTSEEYGTAEQLRGCHDCGKKWADLYTLK